MGHTSSLVIGEVLYANWLVRYNLSRFMSYAPCVGGMINFFSSKNYFKKKGSQVLMKGVDKRGEGLCSYPCVAHKKTIGIWVNTDKSQDDK